MKRKTCGQEILKQKTLKIPELKIEITNPMEWIKSYNEIKIPKGMRLIKLWEMFWIYENKEYRDFVFGEEGNLVFACKQLDIDEKNTRSRWMYRFSDEDLSVRSDYLLNSSSDGRVIFVRKLKCQKN